MTNEEIQRTLKTISEKLDGLSKTERKSNNYQVILWLVQAIIVPLLGWNSIQIAQMMGNRYTSGDFNRHQQEHVMLERRFASSEAKLSNLPPSQISENESDIKDIYKKLFELEKQIVGNN